MLDVKFVVKACGRRRAWIDRALGIKSRNPTPRANGLTAGRGDLLAPRPRSIERSINRIV